MLYFGEDLIRIDSSVSTNSSQVQADFLSNLQGVGVEGLEGFSDNTNAPIIVDFGVAGSATLLGSGEIESDAIGRRRAFSGFSFCGTGAGGFTLEFSEPIVAFGFYGIDLGDIFGQIVLELSNGQSFEIPHSQGDAANVALSYFGIIDTMNLFTSVSFFADGGAEDVFGFDDFTIGSVDQVVNPVSEPASILKFLFGLVLMVCIKRSVS